MSDAVIFAQWKSARRLLERGAQTTLSQAAALGLLDRVKTHFATETPSERDVTVALWHCCRGGHQAIAEFLIANGANINWIGWEHRTPLDVAEQSGNRQLAEWLRSTGALRSHAIL